MKTLGLSKKDSVVMHKKIDDLYAQAHKMTSEKKKNRIELLGNKASDILNSAGQPIYKFIGGPAHGQYTTRKNDTAFFELDGGGYAYYFFLESENCYHWKFWLR